MYALLVFLTLFSLSLSKSSYRDLIPNGHNVPNPCKGESGIWEGVGHNKKEGGGDTNLFGNDFKKHDKEWSTDLCKRDSDNDGRTNGVELGDPNCTWKKGQGNPGPAIGHPGVCEPMDNPACRTLNKHIECGHYIPNIIIP